MAHRPLCLLVLAVIVAGCAGSAATPVPASPPTSGKQPPSPAPPPSEKAAAATGYLKSLPDDLYQLYSKFGVDDDVADYIVFAQSLPKDFRLYALTERLCIQDHRLTELEKQFLKEPERYLQQMFDSYVSAIGRIDPLLATEVRKLPYFKTLEIKDVEAVEDFLWLAGILKHKSTLEEIYGKGIERKMHSVALEALLWRAYTGAYDAYNPLEDPNYSPVFSRLAKFQEKHNAKMDAAEPTEIKFDIRGMNYCDEPKGYLQKSGEEHRFDIALMRWVLRCNNIRLWGKSDINRALAFVRMANVEGLDVYFTACPIDDDGGGSRDTYESCLVEYAKNAEKLGIKYLSVGNEIELWWKEFGGGPWASTPASSENRKTGRVASYVDKLASMVRQHYSGGITYNDYHAAEGTGLMNWRNLDAISLNIYGNYQWTKAYILRMKQLARSQNKPLYWTELGSLTITEAEEADGDDSYTWRKTVHHDEGKQAQLIERWLRLAYETKVDGVFVFVWDRPMANNQNELGFGVWDWVRREPKQSFWTVYRYFKER